MLKTLMQHFYYAPLAAEGKAIIFYCSNLFIFFILSAQMKDQPWHRNQTWPVGRKQCRFTNAPKFWGPLPPNYGCNKHQILTTFSRFPHSTLSF